MVIKLKQLLSNSSGVGAGAASDLALVLGTDEMHS